MRQSSNLNFAVIGLGRYGSALARQLEALGHTVLGVDSDANRVRAIADDITRSDDHSPLAHAVAVRACSPIVSSSL